MTLVQFYTKKKTDSVKYVDFFGVSFLTLCLEYSSRSSARVLSSDNVVQKVSTEWHVQEYII